MKTYVIQPGDNLSKLGQKFGVDWKDIWAANKSTISDPNKIYSGKTISIPDKSLTPAPGGSLEKTLPSENSDQSAIGSAPSATEKSLTPSLDVAPAVGGTPAAGLPVAGGDQLSALKIAMRTASDLAAKSGLRSGAQTVFGSLANQGITPEKVSGGLVGGIIDFVENQTAAPIESKFKSMSDIIDNITNKAEQSKSDAKSQINSAITNGMWNDMSPDQRTKLWSAAGYVGAPVLAKDDSVAYYHTEDNAGNVWNVGYDKNTGAIVRKENLGPIGKASTSPTDKVDLQTATKAMASKLATRVGADGKVSPEDYATAKAAWIQESGFTGKDFDTAMANFRNPTNVDYQLDTEYKGS